MESSVYSWLSYSPENPFEPGTPAYDHFFRMAADYADLKNSSVGKSHNRRLILEEAKGLCGTKPKNPYRFDKKAAEADAAAEKAEAEAYAERQRIAKEKEIQEKAEQIAKAEEERRIRDEQRAAYLKQKEEEQIHEEQERAKQQEMLQKAIEEKRLEIRAGQEIQAEQEKQAEEPVEKESPKKSVPEEKTYMFGVVPEKKEKKHGLFKRLFRKEGR